MPIAITLVPSPAHQFEGHPENIGRFAYLNRLDELLFGDQFNWLTVHPALIEEVSRVHPADMLASLQEASRSGPLAIDSNPTYLTTGSWQAALDSAGGALTACRAILRPNQTRVAGSECLPGPEHPTRGFALIRPPGHHAGPNKPMGFCLLNNLAIAAKDALCQGIGRIGIIDFDGHHGNGTQEIFRNNPQVGFFSCQQEGSFPGTGLLDDEPRARGRLINLPLPQHAGDETFHLIAQEVLWPWLEAFKPEVLFISAGFDGHWSDPVLNLGLTTAGFFDFARELTAMADHFCHGRILFVLEGGYNPPVLMESIAAVLAAMADEDQPPWPVGRSTFLEPDIRPRLRRLLALHAL